MGLRFFSGGFGGYGLIGIQSAQDRSPFCILHIMNEISQHPDLMDTFLNGNHFQIIWEDYQNERSQHFKKQYIQKRGHKMDPYPAL